VHGRRHHDRAARGQQRVGEQVVREPVRGLGQQVRGGGDDQHQVGLLADADVRHLGHVLEHVGVHRVPGECLEGRGADEPERRGRGHDLDRVA
jgi:hypothetical protein